MIPIKKVSDLISRHSLLEKELASGEIDKKKFAEKSKDYSDLNEIIREIKEYYTFDKDKKDLEKIIDDKNSDKDIKELANKELEELIKKNEKNEKKIKLFLLPKDDADAKNAEEEKIENMMNTCGDGTVYENGECVLSPMEKNASDFRTGPLIYSIVIGMSLGIVIMMILWGIGKKSHKVLSDDDS